MLFRSPQRDISAAEKPEGFSESVNVAKCGGKVAQVARQALESETGTPVITSQNAAQLNQAVIDLIEVSAETAEKGKK